MRQEIIELLGQIGAAVLIALLGMVLTAIRAHVKNKMAQDAMAFLAAATATVVGGLANEVRNLKNPGKPGAWTPEEKARMAQRAVSDVRRIGAHAIGSLQDLHGLSQSSIDALLTSLVESQVEELRRSASESTTIPLPSAEWLASALGPGGHPADTGAPLVGVPCDGAGGCGDCENATCALKPSSETPPAASAGRASFGALVFCFAMCASMAACPVVREGVMRVTPGVPEVSHCEAHATRCNGNVPEVCSASGRWWPATPSGEPCDGLCFVSDAGVYCAPANAPQAPTHGIDAGMQ
jgi:hypothetical protein